MNVLSFSKSLKTNLIFFLAIVTCFSGYSNACDNPNLRMGNPSGASISNSEDFLMEKKYYSLSYNNAKGIPNWVSWRLVEEDLGTSKIENRNLAAIL
jgi:DNA/RNA endonuclease G (NUC1)